ncbi:MAG: AAA family ATPase [Burkholderiales bacterium]|nr:AAA family ATPase [Burkholderiales bacterium]
MAEERGEHVAGGGVRGIELLAPEQARLVAALRGVMHPEAAAQEVRLIETHLSYVLLTGAHAYKIKKALSLGFADFSTLARRRHYCAEEIRLNRRLAPAIYLDVVAIAGGVETPVLGGDGHAIEYAVRMREFPQEALLTHEVAAGTLTAQDIDALAAIVAAFHGRIAVARPTDGYGTPADVLAYARENFEQLERLRSDPAERATLAALRAWTERSFEALRPTIAARAAAGFVRECHGDLHLGNIARIDGEIVVFDGIDFNEHLRWIDVASEIAFTAMDLEARGRRDLAHRFVDAYLSISGDYAGLALLSFYVAYRALVRAKVAALRAPQVTDDARAACERECRAYVALARRHAAPGAAAIVVTHGFSGSGKTTRSQAFLEQVGAVRVRTDVERKRLAGLAASAASDSALDAGLYAADATRATYERVAALARTIVASGRVAILDGTFLQRWQRDLARALAGELRVPFAILSFEAKRATLEQRIIARSLTGGDASESDLRVLARQIATHEPLAADELADVVRCDAEAPLADAYQPQAWDAVRARLGLRRGGDEAASPDPGGTAGRRSR